MFFIDYLNQKNQHYSQSFSVFLLHASATVLEAFNEDGAIPEAVLILRVVVSGSTGEKLDRGSDHIQQQRHPAQAESGDKEDV